MALCSLGQGKSRPRQIVTIEPAQIIADPTAIANYALAAAERGARVLLVRNTVRDAVASARAFELVAPDHPSLFRLDGVATLHHGRFARDRSLAARRRGGATHRQRRLGAAAGADRHPDVGAKPRHRRGFSHHRSWRRWMCCCNASDDYTGMTATANARKNSIPPRQLCRPLDFDASLAAVTRDRNGPHGLGGLVYSNLVSLAATRERIGGGAAWTIPSMNRELVEAATHPVTLEALKDRLAARDERWEEIWRKTLGTRYAQGQAAGLATIDWKQPVSDFRIAEDRIGTRLGLGDIEITLPPQRGPFPNSPPIERIVIPAHLIGGVRSDAEPVDILQEDGGFSFRLSDRAFSYRRYGLRELSILHQFDEAAT